MHSSESETLPEQLSLLNNYARTDRFAAARDAYRSVYPTLLKELEGLEPTAKEPEYIQKVRNFLESRAELFHAFDPFIDSTENDVEGLVSRIGAKFKAEAASNDDIFAATIRRKISELRAMDHAGGDRPWTNMKTFSIDGFEINLGNSKTGSDGWFNSEFVARKATAGVKIRVLSSDTHSEAEHLRNVLLPFLHDQMLEGGVNQFKTLLAPDPIGQGAKAFTIYPAPERISAVASDLDKLLIENKLVRATNFRTGNLDDDYIVNGTRGSKRVSIVRDLWPGQSWQRKGELEQHFGAVLPHELDDKLSLRYKNLTTS